MRIALLMHPWQLSFRGKWTWDDVWNDPRGLSGSEMGFVAIARELNKLGNAVMCFTDTDTCYVEVDGDPECNHLMASWGSLLDGTSDYSFDLAIAINHPEGLERFDCPRICLQWVNSFEYLTREQIDSVNLWISPSAPHRRMVLGKEQELKDGSVRFVEGEWGVAELGCYPERYGKHEKVPGRVIYASSPDRGLHHLLYCWPEIKRRVPHAHLKIYYRIQPWIDELKAAPDPFPPIEENRQRALYIEEALRRLSDPKWGVEVVGPVSRVGIEKAMDEAECLAYPCDTLRWSEGFSCTTLEACAAGAQPVVFDCDALGEVYHSAVHLEQCGDLENFSRTVAAVLLDEGSWDGKPKSEVFRNDMRKFAEAHTWTKTTERILELAGPLLSKADSSSSVPSSETQPEASRT